MELTRRDALAALAAGGAVVGGGVSLAGVEPPQADDGDDTAPGGVLDSMTAVATVLYPSTVDGHRPFVETYVLGRLDGREAYRRALRRTVAELDDVAREWYGDDVVALDRDRRDQLLRELGVATAESDPDGPLAERVRHFVVDDLLYAFYASPVGGRLVGVENPIGHPGGLDSYRQASMEGDDG